MCLFNTLLLIIERKGLKNNNKLLKHIVLTIKLGRGVTEWRGVE